MAYVYIHYRKDNGKPFYVGKGTNRRAWGANPRTEQWHTIVENHGYDVSIFKDGLTDDEAFELEKQIISQIGLENLINGDEGGKGSYSGVPKSPEHTKKVIEAWTETKREEWMTGRENNSYGKYAHYRVTTPEGEVFIGPPYDIREKFGIGMANLREYALRAKPCTKGKFKNYLFQIYNQEK